MRMIFIYNCFSRKTTLCVPTLCVMFFFLNWILTSGCPTKWKILRFRWNSICIKAVVYSDHPSIHIQACIFGMIFAKISENSDEMAENTTCSLTLHRSVCISRIQVVLYRNTWKARARLWTRHEGSTSKKVSSYQEESNSSITNGCAGKLDDVLASKSCKHFFHVFQYKTNWILDTYTYTLHV